MTQLYTTYRTIPPRWLLICILLKNRRKGVLLVKLVVVRETGRMLVEKRNCKNWLWSVPVSWFGQVLVEHQGLSECKHARNYVYIQHTKLLTNQYHKRLNCQVIVFQYLRLDSHGVALVNPFHLVPVNTSFNFFFFYFSCQIFFVLLKKKMRSDFKLEMKQNQNIMTFFAFANLKFKTHHPHSSVSMVICFSLFALCENGRGIINHKRKFMSLSVPFIFYIIFLLLIFFVDSRFLTSFWGTTISLQ